MALTERLETARPRIDDVEESGLASKGYEAIDGEDPHTVTGCGRVKADHASQTVSNDVDRTVGYSRTPRVFVTVYCLPNPLHDVGAMMLIDKDVANELGDARSEHGTDRGVDAPEGFAGDG